MTIIHLSYLVLPYIYTSWCRRSTIFFWVVCNILVSAAFAARDFDDLEHHATIAGATQVPGEFGADRLQQP